MIAMAGGGIASTILGQGGGAPGARGARGAAATDTKTTVILLGTQGGPGVSTTRGQTASVVMAGGQAYLMDCGYGTVRALVEAGLRLNDVNTVFVSHLHDDHTADLAALLALKWTGGNTNPPPAAVYGPYGTKAMVEGALAFFKANTEIRIVDEGRTVRAETLYAGHDVAAPKITQVFRDEHVTVLAVENTHFPDRAKEKMLYRSFSYRFNAADRSIVFSGDTAYSTNLVELARGADVFVCEINGTPRPAAPANGAPAPESIARHVAETHSSPEEVGRMASEAKVKTLVLYHMVGAGNGARGAAATDTLTPGIRKFFDGEIIVGNDQMKI